MHITFQQIHYVLVEIGAAALLKVPCLLFCPDDIGIFQNRCERLLFALHYNIMRGILSGVALLLHSICHAYPEHILTQHNLGTCAHHLVYMSVVRFQACHA